MTIEDKYNYYKSLPGYLSLTANVTLAVGIMMLFFNWRVSIPLFIITVVLWFIARNIHKKRVIASLAATHNEAAEILGEKDEVLDRTTELKKMGIREKNGREEEAKERDMKSQDNRVADLIKRMSEGVQVVKLGLYLRLINSLKDTCEMEKAKWLAAAIVNELFSESPPDTKGKIFLESNRTLIEQIISEVGGNKEVCEAVTQAVRVKGIIDDTVGGDTQKVLLSPLEKLRRLGILVPGGKTPEPDSFLSMARKFQGLE